MNDAHVHRLTVAVGCVCVCACEDEQEETWARGMGYSRQAGVIAQLSLGRRGVPLHGEEGRQGRRERTRERSERVCCLRYIVAHSTILSSLHGTEA